MKRLPPPRKENSLLVCQISCTSTHRLGKHISVYRLRKFDTEPERWGSGTG